MVRGMEHISICRRAEEEPQRCPLPAPRGYPLRSAAPSAFRCRRRRTCPSSSSRAAQDMRGISRRSDAGTRSDQPTDRSEASWPPCIGPRASSRVQLHQQVNRGLSKSLELRVAPRTKQPAIQHLVGGDRGDKRVEGRVDHEKCEGVLEPAHPYSPVVEVEHYTANEVGGDLDRFTEHQTTIVYWVRLNASRPVERHPRVLCGPNREQNRRASLGGDPFEAQISHGYPRPMLESRRMRRASVPSGSRSCPTPVPAQQRV